MQNKIGLPDHLPQELKDMITAIEFDRDTVLYIIDGKKYIAKVVNANPNSVLRDIRKEKGLDTDIRGDTLLNKSAKPYLTLAADNALSQLQITHRHILSLASVNKSKDAKDDIFFHVRAIQNIVLAKEVLYNYGE